MVVTKLVDLIAETLLNSIGEDLYKRGHNIAMCNMLHYCMPAFCGEENTRRFLQAFVDLIRRRTEGHVAAFYKTGSDMTAACRNEDFKEHLLPFTDPQRLRDWFSDIPANSLDPAIPALFQHVAIWGRRKIDRFRVIHDSSKPILASQEQFEAMMAIGDEPSALIGYDRRKFQFPLRATSLEQANSLDHPQLQIADLCAGGLAHFLGRRDSGSLDELATLFRDNCLDWAVDAVMPTKEVTPEELGTDADDGVNPVDPITAYTRSSKDK